MANVATDFAQLISQSKSNKTGPYDTQATVKRVEGNTVWVSIPGGVDETPIDKTVNCAAGDKVQVRVSGGRAWITGNASAPPTDDKKANEAKATADTAQIVAVDAKETADAVEGIAQAAQASATTAANAAASAVIAAGNAQTAANGNNRILFQNGACHRRKGFLHRTRHGRNPRRSSRSKHRSIPRCGTRAHRRRSNGPRHSQSRLQHHSMRR